MGGCKGHCGGSTLCHRLKMPENPSSKRLGGMSRKPWFVQRPSSQGTRSRWQRWGGPTPPGSGGSASLAPRGSQRQGSQRPTLESNAIRHRNISNISIEFLERMGMNPREVLGGRVTAPPLSVLGGIFLLQPTGWTPPASLWWNTEKPYIKNGNCKTRKFCIWF